MISKTNYFDAIPDDLMLSIFSFSDENSLVNLSKSSRKFSQEDRIWEYIYKHFFCMNETDLPNPNSEHYSLNLQKDHYEVLKAKGMIFDRLDPTKSRFGFLHTDSHLSQIIPLMIQRQKDRNKLVSTPPIPYQWPRHLDLRRELPYRSMSENEQAIFKMHQVVRGRFQTPKSEECSWFDHYRYNHPSIVNRIRRIGETAGTIAYITTAQATMLLFNKWLDYQATLPESCFDSSLLAHYVFTVVANPNFMPIWFKDHPDRVVISALIGLSELVRIISVRNLGSTNLTDGLLTSVGIQLGFLVNATMELTKQQSNTLIAKIGYSILCAAPSFLFGSGWMSVQTSAFVGWHSLNQFYGKNIIDCRTILDKSLIAISVGSINSKYSVLSALTTAPSIIAWNKIISNSNNPLLDKCIETGGAIAEKHTKPIRSCLSRVKKTTNMCSRISRILTAPVRFITSHLQWRVASFG